MKNPWRIEREVGMWTAGTIARIGGTVLVALIVIGVAAGVAWSTWWEDHKSDRGRGDTSVARVDPTPADAIEMPDTFANVATKCTHGVRIWVTTRGGVYVTDDPDCAVPGG